jgi:hypothetical protein
MSIVTWKIKKAFRFADTEYFRNLVSTIIAAGLMTAVCGVFLYLLQLDKSLISVMLGVIFAYSFFAVYKL